ncbi:MAG: bifunctional oligoribonuclease/PAP phosphatase NrnA [Clostridia bacterium]
MKLNEKKLIQIAEKINYAKTFAIFIHTSPDADALGSASSLAMFLTKLGKTAHCFCETPDQNLAFMCKDIFYSNELPLKTYDMSIALDCSASDRLSIFLSWFKSQKNLICIDHHAKHTAFANLEYVESEASSTCEIILKLMSILKGEISSKMATMLYCGLSADTMSFKTTNVSLQTFKTATKLVELGADVRIANDKLWNNLSNKEFEQLKYVLNNFKQKGNVAYSVIDKKFYKKYNLQSLTTNVSISMLMQKEDVNIAFIIREEQRGSFYLSMRSRIGFDCIKVVEAFGGGGHKQACGCQFISTKKNKLNIQKIVNLVLNQIEKIKNMQGL